MQVVECGSVEKDPGGAGRQQVNMSHCVPRWPGRPVTPGLYQQ